MGVSRSSYIYLFHSLSIKTGLELCSGRYYGVEWSGVEWSRVGLALISWLSKAGITLGSRSLGDYPSTSPYLR